MTAIETLIKRYRSGDTLNDAEKVFVDASLLSRNNNLFDDAALERAAETLAAKDVEINDWIALFNVACGYLRLMIDQKL
jgi:hypothetical protein